MSAANPNVTAVIPVREGSRRMPGKNLAIFNGVSLLQRKINTLLNFLEPERIVVSSNSQEMLDVARRNGVLQHMRPEEFSDDVEGRSLGDTIAHIASAVQGEHILWAQATSPLVSEETFALAMSSYFGFLDAGHDSLISVHKVSEYFRDASGPVNYQTGRGHTPSQQLPPMWKVTYGIIMAPREKMIEWNYYYGENPGLFEIGKLESVDIDDEIDFRIAEFLDTTFGHGSNPA